MSLEAIRNITGTLFQNLWFEEVAKIVCLLIVFLLLYNMWFLLRHYRVLGNPKLAKKLPLERFPPEAPTGKKILRELHIAAYNIYWVIKPTLLSTIFSSLLILLVFGAFVFHYFLTRPYIVFQYPGTDQPWNNARQPITVVFDKPVKKDDIQFNINTDTPGELVWVSSFPQLPEALQVYREFRYFPEQTLLPGEDIVVYVVGIQDITGTDGVHEHALEFTPPVLPDIRYISIEDGQKEVAIDSDIQVEFSVPTGDFVEWDFSLEPEAEFELEEVAPEILKLKFIDGLKQSTKYNLTVSRTLVEKSLSSGETLSSFDPETLKNISFTTIKTPFIEKIQPSGESVKPNANISITFDMQMDEQSVVDNLTINPETNGDFAWEEDHIVLTFDPTEDFQKDTEYTVTISPDAQSISGGKTLKELKHSFRTLGAVKVSSFSPKNNSSDTDPSVAISVKFDQEVDRSSAQSKFTINPAVQGSYDWDGNTMVFRPNGLNYGTTYTVKILKGVNAKFGEASKSEFSTKFTTRSETFVLDVPWYPQEESFTCNIASTRMALAYKGVNLSESSIKNTIGAQPVYTGANGGNPHNGFVDGYGTYWTAISAFISNHRSNTIKQGWNLTEMLQEVRNGNPSIIWWHNQWSDWYWKEWTTPDGNTIGGLNGMHSEVVIGYSGPVNNPTTVITRDPWRGTRYYSASQFKDVWSSSFNSTAVVVY